VGRFPYLRRSGDRENKEKDEEEERKEKRKQNEVVQSMSLCILKLIVLLQATFLPVIVLVA